MVYAFLLLSIAFCCLFSEGWANEIYVVSSFEGTVMDTVEPLKLHGKSVGLKIEIHEIHQNLRNPMCTINKIYSIQQNPLV